MHGLTYYLRMLRRIESSCHTVCTIRSSIFFNMYNYFRTTLYSTRKIVQS